MITTTRVAVILEGGGEALTTPPNFGGVNEDEKLAIFRGSLDLKGGEGEGERGPLRKNRIMAHPRLGAEDGTKEGGGGELEGGEEEVGDL